MICGEGVRAPAEVGTCHLLNARQWLRFKVVNEIVFEVTQDADGGFCAECLTDSIFT